MDSIQFISKDNSNFIIVLTCGLALGILGVFLAVWGNPTNTGLCVSCFMENIAGALGLHGNERMMYLRPEILGFILGAFLTAYFTKEFRSRGGSSPLVRFLFGGFLILGCSVFIGCPIEMVLRLSAGDLNALVGFGGLLFGIFIGVSFLREGFFLGASRDNNPINAIIFIGSIILLLFCLVKRPEFLRFSVKGAGAKAAPIPLALLAGLGIGSLAQRSRFCVTGTFRNLFLAGDKTLLYGLLTFFVTALAINLGRGNFSLDRFAQASSHPDTLWNFLSMALVGWGSILVGGCPFRQLILAGEGDGDAAACVLGMLLMAALVENFSIRSLVAGPTIYGKLGVIIGFIVMVGTGRYLLEEG